MSEEVKIGPNKEGKYTTENAHLKRWLVAAPILSGIIAIGVQFQNALEQWPLAALIAGVVLGLLKTTSDSLNKYFDVRGAVKVSENHKIAAEAMRDASGLEAKKS